MGPHTAAGKEHEEKEVTETTCDELTTTPISGPPVLLGGAEVGKLRAKLSPGRREEWEESVLRFGFISHYLTLIELVVN